MDRFVADVYIENNQISVNVPSNVKSLIRDRRLKQVEIGIDDGRSISVQQRKKAYATLRDIAEHTGYTDEAIKQVMKVEHMLRVGCDNFSLSTCSMTTAREFINTLIEFSLQEGVILTQSGLERTDDIDCYLILCIKHKKCCICGKAAELHHVDTIGMGNNRNTVDDSEHRVMSLCRNHHTIYHQKGIHDFMNIYKVYGIEKYRAERSMK